MLKGGVASDTSGRQSMKTDPYTKTVLTVIALALAVIASRDLGLVGRAAAVGYGEGQKVMITNLKTSSNGFGQLLHVYCENCD
jgi:hypothetical protein